MGSIQQATLPPSSQGGVTQFEMTNDAVIDQIEWGDTFSSHEAGEQYRKVARAEDLPRLIAAFETRSSNPKFKDELVRWDVVTLISLIDTPEASEFLKRIARSRINYQIRYDAMRGLIELGHSDWRPGPDTPKKLRSEFYASLLAYEKYWRGETDLDTLLPLAHSKTNYRGDWWHWITRLEPKSSGVDAEA